MTLLWELLDQLQFDVVAFRLKEEYGVEAIYEPVNVYTARWAEAEDNKKIEALRNKQKTTWR